MSSIIQTVRRTDLMDTSDAAHRMMLKLLREKTPEQKVKMLDDRMEMGRSMQRMAEQRRAKKTS
jgi:hypothetical protein